MMKFSNLEAEITRMGMSNVEFSKKVGIETVTFYNRLKGATTWKLTDMRKVQKFINENLNQNYTLDYLFTSEE